MALWEQVPREEGLAHVCTNPCECAQDYTWTCTWEHRNLPTCLLLLWLAGMCMFTHACTLAGVHMHAAP